jgi:hypothetical protein
MVMPRYLLAFLGVTVSRPTVTGWVRSMRLRLVWCVSWNLSGANIDACLVVHWFASSRVLLKVLHVSSVVSNDIGITPISISYEHR